MDASRDKEPRGRNVEQGSGRAAERMQAEIRKSIHYTFRVKRGFALLLNIFILFFEHSLFTFQFGA
jgi:hypothetical protein